MKNKLLFSLLFVAFAATTTAQDIIVTKQSERIDAKILEISPTEIRYKRTDNPDGPTFVLPKDKVASVVYANGGVDSFEDSNGQSGSSSSGSSGSDAPKTYNRLYRGLEFSLNAGANVLNSSLGYAAGFQPGISIGRRFNEHMYLGISGAYIPGAETIPVYATLRAYVPFSGSRLEFITDVSLGYIIEGYGDPLMFTAVPGLQIPLNNYMDVRVGAGALIIYLLDKSDVAFMSTVNASIGFHSSTDPLSPKPETLYNGLQIGFEGGTAPLDDGLGLGAILSYKLSHKLSFGLGFDYARVDYTINETDIYTNQSTGVTTSQNIKDLSESDYTRYYLRAQYRFSAKRISPFVALDMGLHKWTRMSNGGIALALSPAAGLTTRIGSNSHIDLKVQYNWIPAHPTIDDWSGTSYGGDHTYSNRSLSMSHLFLKIGFTRTLNVLSDRKYSDTIRNKLKLGAIMD